MVHSLFFNILYLLYVWSHSRQLIIICINMKLPLPVSFSSQKHSSRRMVKLIYYESLLILFFPFLSPPSLHKEISFDKLWNSLQEILNKGKNILTTLLVLNKLLMMSRMLDKIIQSLLSQITPNWIFFCYCKLMVFLNTHWILSNCFFHLK